MIRKPNGYNIQYTYRRYLRQRECLHLQTKQKLLRKVLLLCHQLQVRGRPNKRRNEGEGLGARATSSAFYYLARLNIEA